MGQKTSQSQPILTVTISTFFHVPEVSLQRVITCSYPVLIPSGPAAVTLGPKARRKKQEEDFLLEGDKGGMTRTNLQSHQ